MLDALHNLSVSTLWALAASLRVGPLVVGLSRHGLAQIVGQQSAAVYDSLDHLQKQGMTPAHIALVLDAIAQAREHAADPGLLFELVLSGPEVPGVPTADTAATLQTLIDNSETEVVLVGYTVHNGKKLFKRLAERMEMLPELRVVFCLDIARKPADTSLSSEIVRRFAHEFTSKHWPGKGLPEVFYDPRALAEAWEDRASLHAKCVIVDRRIAIVTSVTVRRSRLTVGKPGMARWPGETAIISIAHDPTAPYPKEKAEILRAQERSGLSLLAFAAGFRWKARPLLRQPAALEIPATQGNQRGGAAREPSRPSVCSGDDRRGGDGRGVRPELGGRTVPKDSAAIRHGIIASIAEGVGGSAMIGLLPTTTIFLATAPTDLRKAYDGLAVLVRQSLGQDPLSGSLYVFCNRRRDRIKILFWEEGGDWLCARRLEQGTCRWPKQEGACSRYRREELLLLLGGIDLKQTQARCQRRAENHSIAPV